MNVIVFLHDTLQAIGLKHLFRQYFDLDVVSCFDIVAVEKADSLDAVIITSAQLYYEFSEFLHPRRARLVLVPNQIAPTADEGTIVEALRALIERGQRQKDSRQQSQLSPREENVLALIARGFINKEIADKLEISVNTVLSHRKNIMSKLGIRSVSGLSLYALMNGYVSQNDIAR
ncbi:MAG: LuxR C-terminal-related transcriptional regulator [Muribaculum sp.]|nr:LuxR C-terminal-related transcriptional regulator [Muribaculaceae bacterium]MCM1080356.1 LuxR C-terminal-related transcriptional regulator [Muribaculum sp.]